MKHKTEIEIEMSERIVFSRRTERFESFCPQCQSNVEMASPQIAAILTHTTERGVYRLIEAGTVHFVEAARVFVCIRSLTLTLAEPYVIVGKAFFKKQEDTETANQIVPEEEINNSPLLMTIASPARA